MQKEMLIVPAALFTGLMARDRLTLVAVYDATSGTFKPRGKDASFVKAICHTCHTAVPRQDFVFTEYQKR